MLISRDRGIGRNYRRDVFTFLPTPFRFLPLPFPLPLLFPTSIPLPSPPLISRTPLKPTRGLRERCKLPRGSGADHRPKTNLVLSKAVKPLVAIILSILQCMFYITWSENQTRPQSRGCSNTPITRCLSPCLASCVSFFIM